MNNETIAFNKYKCRLTRFWTKNPRREYFQRRKRLKNGLKSLWKYPAVGLFEDETQTYEGKKRMPDCLLNRHNTMHLSKVAALSLLEMCAQYNMPFASYLPRMIKQIILTQYHFPFLRQVPSLRRMTGRELCVSGLSVYFLKAGYFPFATYTTIFSPPTPWPSLSE